MISTAEYRKKFGAVSNDGSSNNKHEACNISHTSTSCYGFKYYINACTEFCKLS